MTDSQQEVDCDGVEPSPRSTQQSILWVPWPSGTRIVHPHKAVRYFPLDPFKEPGDDRTEPEHNVSWFCSRLECIWLEIKAFFSPLFQEDSSGVAPTSDEEEDGSEPDDESSSAVPTSNEENEGKEISFRYLQGLPRLTLRHTPTALLGFLLFFNFPVILNNFGGGVEVLLDKEISVLSGVVIFLLLFGVIYFAGSALQGPLGCSILALILLIGLALLVANDLFLIINATTYHEIPVMRVDIDVIIITSLIIIILFAIAIDQYLINSDEETYSFLILTKIILFYGMALWLLFGTISNVVITWMNVELNTYSARLIGEGYKLMLFLGGILVYDGMKRTEYLFENLYEYEIVLVDEEIWEEFLENCAKDLENKKSYLFALLFAYPFSLATMRLDSGPNIPSIFEWAEIVPFDISLFDPADIDLIRALLNETYILNFFIVLVAFQFIILIKYTNDLFDPDSAYLGYDPDHYDGRGGYREFGKFATRVNVLLIIGGLYVAYQVGVSSAGSFVNGGTFLAYAVATVSWIYYSFWMMHKKMIRERERLFRQDHLDLQKFQNAPVWPISSQELFSLISANLVPFILLVSRFLASIVLDLLGGLAS